MRGCQCGDFGGQLLSWECNKRRKRGETTILYPFLFGIFLVFYNWDLLYGDFCLGPLFYWGPFSQEGSGSKTTCIVFYIFSVSILGPFQ